MVRGLETPTKLIYMTGLIFWKNSLLAGPVGSGVLCMPKHEDDYEDDLLDNEASDDGYSEDAEEEDVDPKDEAFLKGYDEADDIDNEFEEDFDDEEMDEEEEE